MNILSDLSTRARRVLRRLLWPPAPPSAEDVAAQPISNWKPMAAAWRADGVLESRPIRYEYLLASPVMRLDPGRMYRFTLSVEIHDPSHVNFGFVDVDRECWVRQQVVCGPGRCQPTVLVWVARRTRGILVLASQEAEPTVTRVSVSGLELNVFVPPRSVVAATELPSWGPVVRALHRLCKRSRFWNGFVSAVEMRLGRDELISLPQYMAICPTGQCNALCAFCSVTTGRTGIIKRQLPFEKLAHFLTPVAGVIQMYGLEGNGEPTLYERFDDVVMVLIQKGAKVYLITNGERLTFDRIDLLVAAGLDSVNFSLNAATAETHRRVMKLKRFDVVTANIRRLVEVRAGALNPVVSVSFVVNHENIGEVQEFLRLGECELGVNKILVRPLSELGNDQGTVEDLRDLVPYESEVRDALESVRDYLADVPRRAEIRIDPESFKSYRPDPMDQVLQPMGYKGRLLAPRRAQWTVLQTECRVAWDVNRVRLSGAVTAGPLWQSVPIPVNPGELRLRVAALVGGAVLTVAVRDQAGAVIARQDLSPGPETQIVDLPVTTTGHDVTLLLSTGGGLLDALVDFERLHTPAPSPWREFRLPEPRRWEAGAGASVEWQGGAVRVKWAGPSGPYLLKSYFVPCREDQELALPVNVDVNEGRLGIGFLNEDATSWTATMLLGPGHHDLALPLSTGKNRKVQAVLYSAAEIPLDARVDWTGVLDLDPQWQGKPAVAPVASGGAVSVAPKPPKPPETRAASVTASVRRSLPLRVLGERLASRVLGPGPVRYYCQKPWTDLHNFSVDGRMDVCCIATGPSQERYALGNLFTQSFQEVWNGPTAREFRRTVNSTKPLPPCQRCPMAYSYQGLFFDRAYTVGRVRQRLHGALLLNLQRVRMPFALSIAEAVTDAACSLVSTLCFRGFRRT